MTTKFLVLTYHGSKSSPVISKGFQNVAEYGKGKEKFSEKQLLRLVQFLITENIVVERLPPPNEKSATPHLARGMNAFKLINKELCFYFYK